MKQRLRKEVLAETYKDMQKFIAASAWDFWESYGGDFDDLIAQANLIFIDAFDKYDPSRGAKLSTWIAFKIRVGLCEYMRNGNVYETPHIPIDDKFAETYPASNDNFSVLEFLDEMEQDARIVLQLFLETPRDVMENILNSRKKTNHVQSAMRKRLQNRLRQIGWTMRRTREAFEQIKNVTSY